MPDAIWYPTPRIKSDMLLKGKGGGMLSETWPILCHSSLVVAVSQTLYLGLVAVEANEPITGLVVCATTTGSGLTLAKVCLLDLAGNRLAVSADQSATWNGATSYVRTPFTSPYRPTSDTVLYAGVLQVGTTPFIMPRGLSTTQTFTAVVTGAPAVVAAVAGQSDVAATNTLAAGTFSYWMATYA